MIYETGASKSTRGSRACTWYLFNSLFNSNSIGAIWVTITVHLIGDSSRWKAVGPRIYRIIEKNKKLRGSRAAPPSGWYFVVCRSNLKCGAPLVARKKASQYKGHLCYTSCNCTCGSYLAFVARFDLVLELPFFPNPSIVYWNLTVSILVLSQGKIHHTLP